MKIQNYVAKLSLGTRVILTRLEGHPKRGQEGQVIRILENPSKIAARQWYDVRFKDHTIGRFLQKYLMPHANNKTTAA
jgi:hypothetical protein